MQHWRQVVLTTSSMSDKAAVREYKCIIQTCLFCTETISSNLFKIWPGQPLPPDTSYLSSLIQLATFLKKLQKTVFGKLLELSEFDGDNF